MNRDGTKVHIGTNIEKNAAVSADRLHTLPIEDGFRMPGEFEPHRGCVMIWPVRPGSWPHGAKEAQETFAAIACAIARSETVWMLAAPEQAECVQETFDRCVLSRDAIDRCVLSQGEVNRCLSREDVSESDGYLMHQDVSEPDGYLMRRDAGMGKADTPILPQEAADNGKPVSGLIPIVPAVYVLPIRTDDAWARDVGPTCVVSDSGEVRGIDWQFNAWGGHVDGLYAHWENDNRAAGAICEALGLDCYDAQHFVLEGGSIHSDGEGTVLVTEACLLSAGRNPQMTKEQIALILKQYLGAKKIIWLPRGIWQDETNEHVDNICAFVRPGEVVLAWTDDTEDPQWSLSNAALRVLVQETDARGRKLIVHKLPIPAKPVCITKEELDGFVFEEGEDIREAGERLAASYVNFYISNGAVIVPQFGDENDAQAVEILAQLFPEREIVPIYARPVIVGGGNIHCITQQIPHGNAFCL